MSRVLLVAVACLWSRACALTRAVGPDVHRALLTHRSSLTLTPSHRALTRMCDPPDADTEDAGTECTKRTVHSCPGGSRFALVEGGTLPERFDIQLRALQGDFSPADDAEDTERADSALLAGLVGFPADIPLRVVTQPTSSDEQADLVAVLTRICESAAGVPPTGVEVTPRLGGKVASIAFRVLVASPHALNSVQEQLRDHPRVRMVF